MSGRQFVETLKQLAYPKAHSLDPSGLEWMFECEELVPFLDWFCTNVNSANVLDAKELEEYEALIKSGEAVLDGTQLDEAVKNLISAEEETLSVDDLKKQNDQLKMDIECCRKRKQSLIQKRNRLSLHQTGLTHRLSKLKTVESKAKSQYKKCLEQTQADNTQMNNSLDELVKSVSRTTDLYDRKEEVSDQNSHVTLDRPTSPVFLSQLSQEEYNKTENKFTQELTSYTKRLFFEGIAEMTGQDEGSRYEILEVSDPENLLVRGEAEEINISECKELARIQAFYPKSEAKRINALMNSKQANACVQSAQDIIQSLKHGDFGRDSSKLSQRINEKRNAVSLVKREIAGMAERDIPALIQESTASQVSKILTGDYNLKLARQDYFISNQDKVLNELVLQRSRNEFLTMAYEVEARNHRDIHRLLTAVKQLLYTQLKSYKDRMKMMEDPALNSTRQQRGTIDSRDKFSTNLHHMLCSEDREEKKHLFLTFNSLVQGADKLRQKCSSMKINRIALDEKQEDKLKQLEKSLQISEQVVYSGSSTTSGQPCMTPRQLMESMTQLEEMLRKLEQSIKEVVKDLEKRKQTLRHDTLLCKERRLFSHFFINPSQLNTLFDELSSRLQAQKLH